MQNATRRRRLHSDGGASEGTFIGSNDSELRSCMAGHETSAAWGNCAGSAGAERRVPLVCGRGPQTKKLEHRAEEHEPVAADRADSAVSRGLLVERRRLLSCTRRAVQWSVDAVNDSPIEAIGQPAIRAVRAIRATAVYAKDANLTCRHEAMGPKRGNWWWLLPG